jgi:hypothetical protein
LCPHPPLLFRELVGQRDVAAELRDACRTAARRVTASAPDRVVVAGPADTTRSWDPDTVPDVRQFGTVGPRNPTGLPPSLGVGVRLLEEAGWTGPVELLGVAGAATPAELEKLAQDLVAGADRVALLLLGDGSTRRGQTAPGYIDERAFGFDEQTGRALADGDASALVEMDVALAEDLMVHGRPTFQLLGLVAATHDAQPRADLTYQDDPFGVMYFVAHWDLA